MKHTVQFIFSFMVFMAAMPAFAQFTYISPLPNSKMKNKQTTIILKNGGFIDQSSLKNNLVSITGTKSGSHTARIVLSDDGKTICIYPQPVFQGDETVSVSIADGFRRKDGIVIQGTSFQFATHPDHPAQPAANNDGGSRLLCTSLINYDILTNTSDAFKGDIFFYNFWSSITPCWARTIISNSGDSLYYSFDNSKGLGFEINHNGYLTYFDANARLFYMADSAYNVVTTFQMGNGYFADEHDFQIFPNGYYFMLGLDTSFLTDLTGLHYTDQFGDTHYGNDSVNVVGNVVQELDPSGNVIFEWNSFDHYAYQDAMFWQIPGAVSLGTNGWWDWFHANSVEFNSDDSTILLSSRHYSEVAKISLSTGEFIWHWGGKNNEFHFINDESDLYVHPVELDSFYFSGQHDVRRLANGHITMFNNDYNLTPQISSAKEYVLDEVNKTATLVWQFYHPQINGFNLYGLAMGSVQRLENGNTFIDWGLIGINQHYSIMPKMTEVDSLGNIVWEFTWPYNGSDQYASYRARKFAWERCNLIPDASLQEDSIGVYSAFLSWGTNPKISGYILEYKLCSEATWTSVALTSNSYDLQGLLADTCYDWRVQSICSIYGDTSTFSAIQQFTTLLGVNISPLENPLASFELFPNPTSGEVEARFTISVNQQVGFTIYNLLGGIVKQEILNAHAGTNKVKIDLKNLASGAYHVELKAGTQTMHHRLVVN
ncbi:MAG TPA: aryl-sulfate sulfotransferase [Chitinophagales bacterium]|nr:aryl-sulfate sulfotransferase [Chitinophagales bacterium]